MDTKLIEQCKKHIKKGTINELYKYINENNLTQEFITQVFYSTFRRDFQGKEYEEAISVSNFALKLLEGRLKQQYGEKLAERLEQIIYNEPEPMKRNINLLQLMNSKLQVTSEAEVSNIEKILDIASSKDNLVGTHIIGADIR